LQYFDPDTNESFVPYVVETSLGLDRIFLQIISASYHEEEIKKDNGTTDTRTVFKLPPVLAPVKLAILPLVKKDGLPEISRRILDDLKYDFNCQYEEKDSIGRRYRRQDAIGTPYCITVDHQTTEDNTVTIRYRDSMKQERIHVDKLKDIISDKVDMSSYLRRLDQD
jgi:glycyl-tRNA synthetase